MRQGNYALNLVRSGEGRLLLDGGRRVQWLGPGSVYQHLPGATGRELIWDSPEVEEVYLVMDPGTHARLARFGAFPDSAAFQLSRIEPVLERLEAFSIRVSEVRSSPLRGGRLRNLGEIVLLLADLFQLIQRGGSGEVDEAVRDVCTRFETKPADREPLPDIARELGIGYATLRRRFREQVGLSMRAYRIQCRMARAMEWLAEYTVGETAERLGYTDPFVFSNQFRAETGMSPSTFRRRLRPR
jgi:AraC-like DNA-binding protein